MTMHDLCTDNRFELIDKYRQRLIEATNIETDLDEMKVLDSILFRFWQMGWLDRLEEEKHGRWLYMQKIEDKAENIEWQQAQCSVCHKWHTTPYLYYFKPHNYCPNCGARMDGDDHEEVEARKDD